MNNSTSLINRGLKFLLNTFITQTKVVAHDKISSSFSVIEVTSDKIKSAKWTQGDKVQVGIGGLKFRTFTPIQVDAKTGSLSLLCHRRTGSPATQWIESLKIGTSCEIFGPRKSLDFANIDGGNVAIFGDETTFGAAKVLQSVVSDKASLFFEVNSMSETEDVFGKIGIENSIKIQRASNDSHLQEIAQNLIALNQHKNFTTIFLTGRASSIQKMRNLLKQSDIHRSRLQNRAYWADGKVGLD